MLRDMPGDQFMAWMRYDELHPIGDLRNEVEHARTRLVIASTAGAKNLKLADFLWSFKPETKAKPLPPKDSIPAKVLSFFRLRKPDGD